MKSQSEALEPLNRESFVKLSSAVVIITGSLVLIGWALDVMLLKSILPGFVTMKANTALAFALAGSALLLLRTEQANPQKQLVGKILALITALIGLLTLAQYLFGWNLGIYQLLFAEHGEAVGTLSPGRMAPTTALNFFMLGVALLVFDTRRGIVSAQILTILAFLISLLALAGYTYNVSSLYTVSRYTSMAVHTAVAFTLLSAALLFAHPDRGLMRLVVSNTVGGVLVRRFLPAVIVIPILFGWLGLRGQEAGLYGTEFDLVLIVVSGIVTLSVIILWNARSLDRIDVERKQALTISNELFQGLFESAPDAVIVVNREGKIVRVNALVRKMFGYDRGDLIHQPIEVLIPQRFKGRHVEHRLGYVASPRVRPMGTGLDLYAKRKDGTEFPVDITLGPLRTNDGEVVLCTVRDITERKKTEAALARHAQELARSNAELEQFAYVASHDLQEPLRMISSFTQLIERRYRDKLDNDANDFINYAVNGANKLQTMINDLLEFSRVGTRGKSFEATDTHSALGQAMANLGAVIEESGAVITNDELPTVVADSAQLVRLFQNLIGNAMKFRSEHQPLIHISAKEKPSEWQFSVRDNGIGIASEYHKRIFVIFQRLSGKEEHGGTGIGLAICKRIVERHGGKIWVESGDGKGSTFYFTIPKRQGGELS